MILSLGEDRCEEENDKVFTRSALIKSDLWRAGEEVKAKKEKVLMRARNACARVRMSSRSLLKSISARRDARVRRRVTRQKSETLVVMSRVSMERSPCFSRLLPPFSLPLFILFHANSSFTG